MKPTDLERAIKRLGNGGMTAQDFDQHFGHLVVGGREATPREMFEQLRANMQRLFAELHGNVGPEIPRDWMRYRVSPQWMGEEPFG
jgi:hypothetical protein